MQLTAAVLGLAVTAWIATPLALDMPYVSCTLLLVMQTELGGAGWVMEIAPHSVHAHVQTSATTPCGC